MLTTEGTVRHHYLYFIAEGSGIQKEPKVKRDLELDLPGSCEDCVLFMNSHGMRNWLSGMERSSHRWASGAWIRVLPLPSTGCATLSESPHLLASIS